MYREPGFIQKLFTHARLETLVCLLSAFLAVWGSLSYFEFLQSADAERPYVPVMFMFGIWPFVVCIVLSLFFAALAAVKTQRG